MSSQILDIQIYMQLFSSSSPGSDRYLNSQNDMLRPLDSTDTGRLSQDNLQTVTSKSIMRQASSKSANRDSRVTIRVPEGEPLSL